MSVQRRTEKGGYLIIGQNRWADFEVEWDAAGNLVKQRCRIIPTGRGARPDTPCGSCKDRQRSMVAYLRGAWGLAKAELGFDPADPSVVKQRKNICMGCDHYDFGACGKCTCWLAKKVLVKSESCPDGMW